VVHKDVGGYADVLFTTENRILQHREEVLAAVESFIESWRQSFANPHEAADAFINDARIRDIESLNIWNQQMVVQAIERSRDFVLDDEQIKDPTAQIGLQNEKSWGETIRLMTSLNLPKTPQAKDCFSNEFVQTHILKRESLK
jgi:hypothetical protein